MSVFYKIFLIASLFVSYSNVSANNFWIRLNSPTSATLRNCSFVDAFNGWASGDSGIIVHTSNGGNTFVIQNTTIDFYINDIYFINKRLGWAVANIAFFEGSTILKTTNGGNLWTATDFFDSTKFLKTIYFLDSLNGYLGSFGGDIFKTTDAGNSWLAATVDSSKFSHFPISKFKFVSNDLGFACGGQIDIAGVVWRTTNAGLLWKAENLSPEPFYDLFIKDSQRIIAAGGDYEYGVQISKTTNGGLNWNYQSLGLFGQAYSIDFRTGKEAWMPLGYAGSWAVSYDSGMSWSSIPAIDSSEIYSVDFVDSLNGWAVGLDGVILKYNYLTNINGSVNFNSPTSIFLYQNYPNPFNPKTIINYEIPSNVKRQMSDVKLIIYNVLGKKVATLVNEKQNAGNYEVEFNGQNLPSGIYYYHIVIHSDKLEAGDFVETKKMLLLK